MKKMYCLAVCLVLMMTALPCALAQEAEIGLCQLRLGNSGYTVMVDEDFVSEEITQADRAKGQAGYYVCDDTKLDFDVYQIEKADASQTLSA